MTKDNTAPFTIPAKIEPNLARVQSYWKGLFRGENKVPFWDDVRLSSLGELAEDAIMLHVFDNPLRFRFAIIGRQIESEYGRSISGKFVDELERKPPIEHLEAQCRVAVEHQSPTCFQGSPSTSAESYSRMVLPLWGEGRVSMLLAAILADDRALANLFFDCRY
jgi:hypothetical protein